MNDDSSRIEAMIDEALDSYPQRPLPTGFVNQVMTKVKAQSRVQPERFRLQLLDVALTLCFGGMVSLVLFAIFGTFGIVDFGWVAGDMLNPIDFVNSLSASVRFWLILGIILFAELGLVAGVCVQLWQDRPYTVI